MPILRARRDDNERRLDRVLRRAYPAVPPGAIARAIRTGAVRVNQRRVTGATRIRADDAIVVPEWHSTGRAPRVPRGGDDAPRVRDRAIVTRRWSAPILARTDNLLVLSKPAEVAVHGRRALDEAVRLVASQAGWWSESVSFRPGPAHRLDRDTTGVLIFALSGLGARELAQAFERGVVSKAYLALVAGGLTRAVECDRALRFDGAARKAVFDSPAEAAHTRFVPLQTNATAELTLALCLPTTGRRHQIRAHAAAIGHPLVEDRTYGGPSGARIHRALRFSQLPGGHMVLHALVYQTPLGGWSAPLPSVTYGALKHVFGDLTGVTTRLRQALAGDTRFDRSATVEL